MPTLVAPTTGADVGRPVVSKAALGRERSVSSRSARLQLVSGILCLGIASLHGESVLAQAWLIQPTVGLTTQFEDNIRLDANDPESATTFIPTVQGLISRQTETMDVRALARYSYRIYQGEANLEDRGQALARLGSEFRTERSLIQLDGAWRREDSFSDRFFFDPDLPGDIDDADADTRLFRVQLVRNRADIVPRYRYRVSERTTVGASLAYQKQYYEDDDVDLDFSEYEQYTYSLDHAYALSELTQWTNRLLYIDYDAPNRDRQYRTSEYLTGIESSFTERLGAGVEVGWRGTDFEVPGDEGSNDGYSLRLNARYVGELWSLRVRLTHRLVPSSFGDVVEQDQALLNYRYKLTPRLNLGLRARYFENESLLLENERSNRQYLYLEPSLDYSLSLAWLVRAEIFHEREDRDATDGTAENTGIMFSVVWTPPSELD